METATAKAAPVEPTSKTAAVEATAAKTSSVEAATTAAVAALRPPAMTGRPSCVSERQRGDTY